MKPRAAIHPQVFMDLDEHADYIAQRNPKAAIRFYEAAEETFQDLAEMPESGSRCDFAAEKAKDLRMWPVKGFKNYIIFFRPTFGGVDVVRVVYATRDFEAIFA
jgi:toxin ParE1/3/4